jgi:hypothetical protein
MSMTWNRQHRRFPASGQKLTADAAPLSSRLPADLMQGVNNLNYCSPFFGFVQSFITAESTNEWDRLAVGTTAAASAEYFVGQVPTILPKRNLNRFCWTMGMYLGSGGGSVDSTVTGLNLYISPEPYKGHLGPAQGVGGPSWGGLASIDTPFDETLVAQPAGGSSLVVSHAIPASTTPAYVLFDKSAGTAGGLPFFVDTHADSEVSFAHLIWTISMETDDASTKLDKILAYVADVSFWVEPE